jgi:hypothetical protein
VILDSSDFTGFQFGIGLAAGSNFAAIRFPAVVDRDGVPAPPGLTPQPAPTRADVLVPTILPIMQNLCPPVTLRCAPNTMSGQLNLQDGAVLQPWISRCWSYRVMF